MNYLIRQLVASDCSELSDLLKESDFKVSKCMSKILFDICPNGILVAQDIDSGKLLGTCSGLKLWPDYTDIGFYCVKPQYRKLGIGSAIWHKLMERIGSDMNIGLISVYSMIEKYKRIGFNVVADRNAIYTRGRADWSQLTTSVDGVSVVPISKENIKQVVDYDKRVSNGLNRMLVIEEHMKSEDSVTAVAIDGNQQVVGYCILCVSICETISVEPLYADNKQIAELLIAKCCQRMPLILTNDLVVFCWNTNSDALKLIEKMSLQLIKEVPQLFTKRVIDVNVKQIYFLFSPYFYPC